jgi:hypothetical protein
LIIDLEPARQRCRHDAASRLLVPDADTWCGYVVRRTRLCTWRVPRREDDEGGNDLKVAADGSHGNHFGRHPFFQHLRPIARARWTGHDWRRLMNGLIYLVGLIVVIMAVLSLLGLR